MEINLLLIYYKHMIISFDNFVFLLSEQNGHILE